MHHVAIVTVLVVGGFARAAVADTINVPGDASTIQADFLSNTIEEEA